MNPTTIRFTPDARRRYAMRLSCAITACLTVGCHNAADLTEQSRATSRAVLSLHTSAPSADTMRVTVHLDAGVGGGPMAVGSLTGDVVRSEAWRFVQCDAPQGHPLLACNERAGTVRIAAAWVEGITTGDLVTLSFVSAQGVSAGSATVSTSWQLNVQEVHAVSGASVLDGLDVRREAVR